MYKYSILILLCIGLAGLIAIIFQLRYKHPKAILITFGVALIAMLFFNTYLTSLPIVMYNTSSILGVYVSSFPVEDIGYLLAVIMIVPPLFEQFCNEEQSKKHPTTKTK
jgi:lycopene cyclase domain-containing protein